LMLFKGYFKTAVRRFTKKGSLAHLEGVHFQCYYYTPSYVLKHIKSGYQLKSLKGLCITIPPPFIEGFIDKHPKLFAMLQSLENKLWTKAPYNRWCDHYIITMQKPYNG